MPFAIGALFDAASESSLQALRNRLIEVGYADPQGTAVRPHLTFAILDTLDAEALRPALRDFCYAMPPLPIRLASVGTFPTEEGVVYLAPVVTQPLLEVHARLHRVLQDAGLRSVPYYQPQNWIPHCTVAINLTAEQICGAVDLCRQADVFHNDQLTQLVVAEFPPMRSIYALPLRGDIAPSELVS